MEVRLLETKIQARDTDAGLILHLFTGDVGNDGTGPATLARSEYTAIGLTRVMAWFALPARPTQGVDDLGRQENPPGLMRRGLDRLETTGFTPVGYRGDIDIEPRRGGFRTVTAIAPLAAGTGARCLRALTGDSISVTDPVDFSRGEGIARAGAKTFGIQLGGDLGVGVCWRQRSYPLDHGRCRAPYLAATGRTRHLQGRAGVGLPADGQLNHLVLRTQGDILNQPPQQLLALRLGGGWCLPQRR